jgi:hypothetical protein
LVIKGFFEGVHYLALRLMSIEDIRGFQGVGPVGLENPD